MKSKFIPMFFTILFIVLIICFFASIKQEIVTCYKRSQDVLGNIIIEELSTTIDGNDIKSMKLVKKLVVSSDYVNDIDAIILRLEKAYEYLGNDVLISVDNNAIIVEINIDKDQTVILNNIKFNDNGSFEVDTNTKSNDVLTFTIGDKYTESELMTRLKSNGYTCR